MNGTDLCSATCLPVYEVAETGITEDQAHKLAAGLKIPADNMSVRHGIASFVDPARYLAVPSVAITDPDTVDAFRRTTTNHHPEIPIEISAIDYATLDRLTTLDQADALRATAAALDAAGLTPDHATPVVGHTVLTTVITDRDAAGVDDNRGPLSMTRNLDTHVSHRFTVGGYLLVGPGAQIQVSYTADGTATRLVHSTRTLTPGPSVPITPPDALRTRLARCLPDDAEIRLRLVYWAPPLTPGLNPLVRCSPTAIIPWYAATITRQVHNPATRTRQTHTSRIHLIPATEDPRFVPTVTMTATALEDATVDARTAATGGTPPYTYLWAGSNPDASATFGPTVTYTPVMRDQRRVMRAQTLQRTETVTVTVIDANGIPAHATHTLHVTAQPAPDTHNSVTYGCESPNDPGPSTADGTYAPERIAWQQAMGANGAGGGSQRFCWLADDSWPGDYIAPSKPGSLEPSPWINGDADYANWGINTTNIMLYNGDGSPTWFAEMYPGATPDDYNSAGGGDVWAPGPGATVGIGSHDYDVNYVGSWGAPHPNDNLQWLAMYACEILQNDNTSGPPPWQRWGPAFNGLHSMVGFETDASDAGVGFMTDFPQDILGTTFLGIQLTTPQTIVQGWINSAIANQMGTPAAMGPIENVEVLGFTAGIWNYNDYYWGKGSVGPTIPRSQINGWWYIQGTDAVQEFP